MTISADVNLAILDVLIFILENADHNKVYTGLAVCRREKDAGYANR
jgi:hypothetical protein